MHSETIACGYPYQISYVEVLRFNSILCPFYLSSIFSLEVGSICSEYTLVASGNFYFIPNIKAKKVVQREKYAPSQKCEQLRSRKHEFSKNSRTAS